MASIKKEALVKNIFWIGLGAYGVLCLILLIVIMAVGGGAVAAKQTEFNAAKDEIGKLASSGNIEGGHVANESWTAAYQKKKKNLEERKLVVWRDAWNLQNKIDASGRAQDPLFFWPTKIADHVDTKPKEPADKTQPAENVSLKDRSFGVDFDGDPAVASALRDDFRDKEYPDELEAFYKADRGPYPTPVGPAYYLDSWEKVIQPVVWDKENTPINRDVWLAQEDLCVKRELVRVIREAIDSVARFRVVEREFRDKNGKAIDVMVPTADFKLVPAPKKDDKGLSPILAEPDFPKAFNLPRPKTKEEWEAQKKQVEDFKDKARAQRQQDLTALDAQAQSATFKLRNASWELDLIVEKDPKKGGDLRLSTESKIRNIHPDGRTLARNGVIFRLQPRDPGGEVRNDLWITIEGDPLAHYEASAKGPEAPLLTQPLSLPDYKFGQTAEVEQYLTWYNSPVKRVDKIEVGTERARSHRTAVRPLLPAQQFPMPADTGAPAPGGTVPGASPMGGAPPAPMAGGPPPGTFTPPGVGSPDAGGAAKAQVPISPLRYIDTSDQVRRLPVGLVLVVDQANVPEVLSAIANSRLQMWTTQYHWKHVTGIPAPNPESSLFAQGGRPAGPGDTVGPMSPPMPGGPPPRPGGGFFPPVFGGPPMPGGFPKPPGGFGTGFPKPPGPGTGSPDGMGGMDPMGAGALSQDDPNLVELAVYAIASLYERPPAEKAEPAPDADQNKQP